ncbi:hypothetical protein L202_01306 [Cryptococcus amylolentus CBS 6039]|uniref:thioredoxin-dependent peroxiredoxin n=2 Tax=Cryptococcus amylolentus TaxID=104669 RepID=A0A1E3I365_9TREE|nr:hypothetical protein L202_01306 [Cryptococcus amylolentus CBS 6039]ODN83093.1 hypothetical protein L202_01306 [Cryptococcus amylolentus CBS 6039]ODO10696.1 hypothetical protein I350_01293 [Cryptococcus amylolentus CBS 6273]
MVKHSDLIGKAAPSLQLPSIPDGSSYKLPLGQKPIALFFFPAAGTMGCTMEACSLRDARVNNIVFQRHPELEVVGVSGDPTDKQTKFADEHGLSYPILSDIDGQARKLYGVGSQFFGMTPGRETFFIDEKGIVRGVCDSSINVFEHTRFIQQQLVAIEKEKEKI